MIWNFGLTSLIYCYRNDYLHSNLENYETKRKSKNRQDLQRHENIDHKNSMQHNASNKEVTYRHDMIYDEKTARVKKIDTHFF